VVGGRKACQRRVSLQRQALRGHAQRRWSRACGWRRCGAAARYPSQSNSGPGGSQTLQKTSTIHAINPFADGDAVMRTTKTRKWPVHVLGRRVPACYPVEAAACTGLLAWCDCGKERSWRNAAACMRIYA
jgi:hypothetical protein